jgi:hypothetical protein
MLAKILQIGPQSKLFFGESFVAETTARDAADEEKSPALPRYVSPPAALGQTCCAVLTGFRLGLQSWGFRHKDLAV